jgi:glucose-1-phosphate thymidylyltransferase
MRAFILAGGFATRLWPLTEARAKPLLPLAGKPIINYIIDSLPANMPVAVSTNAAFGADFLAWKQQYGYTQVEVVVEQTANDDAKLGTLGALSQWLTQGAIVDDIVFITGDNYFGVPLTTIINAFTGQPLVAAHDIGSLTEASRYGTVVVDNTGKRVTAFEEKPDTPNTTLISTGASVLPASVLPILHEYAQHKPDNVGGIFEELLARKHVVECLQFSETWYDIGSFWAYLDAIGTLVGNQTQTAAGVLVQNSHCTGSVVLGERVVVHNSQLENVVLLADCVINNCVLRNCIIDEHCVLEQVDLDGKMIRAHTSLINRSVTLPIASV